MLPFFCDLCSKGYARAPAYQAHLGSYDHTHKQRLRDMKAMVREAGAPDRDRARRAEARSADMVKIDVDPAQEAGQHPVVAGEPGSKKAGFKKSGFKPAAFIPVSSAPPPLDEPAEPLRPPPAVRKDSPLLTGPVELGVYDVGGHYETDQTEAHQICHSHKMAKRKADEMAEETDMVGKHHDKKAMRQNNAASDVEVASFLDAILDIVVASEITVVPDTAVVSGAAAVPGAAADPGAAVVPDATAVSDAAAVSDTDAVSEDDKTAQASEDSSPPQSPLPRQFEAILRAEEVYQDQLSEIDDFEEAYIPGEFDEGDDWRENVDEMAEDYISGEEEVDEMAEEYIPSEFGVRRVARGN